MPQINLRDFHKGQSSTPYLSDGAFSKSQNLDVFSQKGIARIAYLPTAGSGTVSDLPLALIRDSGNANNIYAIDDSNNVYLIDPTQATHTITDKGDVNGKTITHWKGYLLGINGSTLRYNSSGTTWANWDGAPTISHSVGNMLFFPSVNDGKLYVVSGNDVDSITEDTDFNPSSAATFTVTVGAFTLPEGYWALGMAELGAYLIIAAVRTTSAFSSTLKNPVTTYFFWDRTKTTADKIIDLPEKEMTNLLGIGGNIFVSGGNNGNIYTISESGIRPYAQIPFDYDNVKTIQIGTWAAPSMAWWQNMLLVGVTSKDGLNPAGIYGIDSGGKISHLFTPSDGKDGSDKDILIGGIYPYDETTLYFGWENDTDNTYGIDEVITSGNRQTSYASYLESQFQRVGIQHSLAHFGDIDIQLARPLQTGEGVRLKFRENINDSWTTIQTRDDHNFDFATFGAISQFTMPFNKRNVQNIQFRVELTTGSSSTNTPYLLDVTIPYEYD